MLAILRSLIVVSCLISAASAQVQPGTSPLSQAKGGTGTTSLPYVDIRTFGAKCDGSTNDLTAINNAIASLPQSGPAVGGIVVIPKSANACIVAGTINLNAKFGIVLRGSSGITGGRSVSTLQYTGSGARFIDARDSSGVALENVWVGYSNASFTGILVDAGGNTAAIASPPTFGSVSTAFAIRNSVLSPNGVPGTATLLNLDQAIEAKIENNWFGSGAPSVRGALVLSGSGTINAFKGNQYIGHVGPAVTGCGDSWSFTGETFEADSNGRANAFSNAGLPACVGLSFKDSWFGDVTTNGGTWISAKGSGFSFTGSNRITANTNVSNEAIAFFGMDGCTISGSTFENFSGAVDFSSGTTTGCVVTGNKFTNVTNVFVNTVNAVGLMAENNSPSASRATSGQLYIGQSSADAAFKTITGDATFSAAGAVTFATVNANVGSFGSATQCVSFTTNGKGLITAASATTCLPNIANVAGMGTGVIGALQTSVGSAGAFVVNGGALGTPSSGTLTNASGLPTTGLTGTLQAAQEPAHTGDCTNSAGSLALTCTGINGVNQNASWTTYTPTVSSQGGTPTSVSATGRYKQIGKTIILEANVTITTAGTATGQVYITLPTNSAAFNYAGSTYEWANTGKSGAGSIVGSVNATRLQTSAADATTWWANGNTLAITAVYEVP